RTSSDQTRLTVLRVALGLYSKGASKLRQKITAAITQCDGREGLRSKAKYAEQRFESVRHELAEALGVDIDKVWPPPQNEALEQDETTTRDVHRVSLMALVDKRIRETSALSTDPSVV